MNRINLWFDYLSCRHWWPESDASFSLDEAANVFGSGRLGRGAGLLTQANVRRGVMLPQLPSDVVKVPITKAPWGHHVVQTARFEVYAEADLVGGTVPDETPAMFAPHDGEEGENAKRALRQ